MNRQDRDKLLKKLANHQFGEALEDWVNEQTEKLENETGAKSWEEVLGRREAKKIIRKLFKFLKLKSDSKKTNQYL